MARYAIAYTDGDSENVNANRVELREHQYVLYRGTAPIGHIPAHNVRSIIRHEDPETTND